MGEWGVNDPRIVPPPKEKVYTEMEALIQHFLLYPQGFAAPAGGVYVPVEGPRGNTAPTSSRTERTGRRA